jgi:hypothetical protein
LLLVAVVAVVAVAVLEKALAEGLAVFKQAQHL